MQWTDEIEWHTEALKIRVVTHRSLAPWRTGSLAH